MIGTQVVRKGERLPPLHFTLHHKVCEGCGDVFEGVRYRRFCSQECYRLVYHYAATIQDIQRLRKASRVCEICGVQPNEEWKTKLCADHDHTTGALRGWLCQNCNSALGKLENHLERALSYVQRYKEEVSDAS